ncbi:hypothetical protein A2641_02990 [Candidatus Nomurabacteria bacterium RIFCSPHIGHO2_01_FULL_37_25]|uniref:N-acetyltransferase domain-containing protein n=1 Tax=Candidatus Nomurabacteria bacterium RIFCSPLOWO2_01_FULL_36_16 TaxID=1801767 RepID=A0A1F6WZI1_9BACT|nr:MAG: hypothetical protein A2641_02990 [Candidatus Nomurabacteria bacterium RIFCSPHIGHO2_01_FULL_37_25]OGI75458.1 MAG: hypothetical protein A3D36_02630 [Candidatus Nomurabacteria bacterium RIFCSPHIGHO2_02_FULL_36_29]OGI87297.1 MAG: hypothetical protein A3A91_02255 [Candidatus Nomurabacteria bacterium RIFCSPLOWO2_01_FULL_36_16]OGI95669.1 MAG: hypothetical protein A3I84_01350 [Candidatus Nomurabacteria bacterium RIFCSPLOWO2_02_FULL_36_8]
MPTPNIKIFQKSDLGSLNLPLPIYNTVIIGEATNKEGKEFSIFIGLDKNMVTQLKALSLDENDVELQNNTSDLKRFGEGLYEDWYKKNRTPFALAHGDTNTLAAIIWLGPKPLGRKSLKHLSNEQISKDETELNNKDWHTLSARCYAPFRGTGVMKYFGNFVVDFYLKKFPGIKLWSTIERGNTASLNLFLSLGFIIKEEISDDTSIVTVKE